MSQNAITSRAHGLLLSLLTNNIGHLIGSIYGLVMSCVISGGLSGGFLFLGITGAAPVWACPVSYLRIMLGFTSTEELDSTLSVELDVDAVVSTLSVGLDVEDADSTLSLGLAVVAYVSLALIWCLA